MIKKYRKKAPIVVEAVKFTGNNCEEIRNWSHNKIRCDDKYFHIQADILAGRVGDYILKNPDGRFWPCDSDFFEKNYKKIGGRKYREEPPILEVIKFTGDNWKEIGDWGNDKIVCGTKHFYIQTLEGEMTGKVGDYIIKGINGEFYPCKPDIFLKTYEEVRNGK